jgi:predicted Zn-dependent protease
VVVASVLTLVLLAAGPAAAGEQGRCPLPASDSPARMPGVSFEDLAGQAGRAWAEDRFEEAMTYFRAGVALNPLWIEGQWRVAQIYSAGGCHAEARDVLRRLLAQSKDSANGWALLGLSEYRLGEYDRALASLSRSASFGLPISADALHALTLLLVREGDSEAAAERLGALVRLRPDDAEVVAACGLLALRMRCFPSEVPAEEEDLVTRAGRAACTALAGRTDEARPLFDDLVARYPQARGVHLAYGLVLSREALPEALAQLHREVELFPDNAEAQVELAFEILARGHPPDALDPARAAVRLAPESFWSHVALGRALLATDQLDEATAQLERAQAMAPDEREICVALAQAYARADRPEELERTRQRLRELDARRGAGRE